MADINSGLYSLGGQRPYPNFGPIGEMASSYNSHYNSLQVSVEKRMSYGLSFLADYTWARATDDFSESINTSGSFYATNPFDRNANYGLSADDIANSIKFSSTWQVPRFHLTGLADKLANGWAIAPILTWHSGLPFSVMCGCDNALTGDGNTDRADFVPGATVATAKLDPSRSHSALIQEYFNIAAFTQSAPGTFGDTGKNILIGPGLFDTDIALLKNTKIGERFTVQFRAEAFNAFNSVNFGQPDTSWSDSLAAGGLGTFGTITSTSTNPRIMQLGLKLLF
jgi:hypothetical protein